MTSGTSANGTPKDSTTWLSTRGAGGVDPGRQDRQRREHRHRPAGWQRDPEPDEAGHDDLAGVGADAGGGDAGGQQRHREHQGRAAAGEPAEGGVGLADGVQPGTVSQYVLRNAPCPVLTVPGADLDSRGLETAQ
jgi:hypothetical protein